MHRLALVLLIFSQACNYQHMEADLIIHNATIYSVDEQWSTYQAMAIKDGKIIGLGAERDILNKYKAKERFDAAKQAVYPGFIDAHCHFIWQGSMLNQVDLTGITSLEETLERLKNKSPNRGEWVLGRGWDQNLWEGQEFPNADMLDALFPETPVYLVRIDGHAAWVNSAALKIANIKGEEEVTGGKVLTKDGKPTGILIDRAIELVSSHIPQESEEETAKLIQQTEKLCFASGITALTDAGLPVETIRTLMKLDRAGGLKMNINQMVLPGPDAEAFLREGHHHTDHISVRSFKLFADGALGSRGALLLEPYTDDPENSGLMLNPMDEYEHWAQICKETGYQLCTHAIGDSANRMVLDLYARHLEKGNDARWRIEHTQIVAPEDINKFGEYNIIPSIQPTHATSDMGWAEERLGPERLKTAYAFEQLRQQLGLVALGTDFPIEQIDPLATFYSAVFRSQLGSTDTTAFLPDNALSRKDALRGMTIWAAIAQFQENERGTISVGKQADLVILNRDLMKAPQSAFQNIEVVATFIKGEKVFEGY